MAITTQNIKEITNRTRIETARWLLGDIAELMKVMSEKIGKEEFKKIFLEMRKRQLISWMSSVVKKDISQGKENNLKSFIDFLLRSEGNEGITNKYEKKKDGSIQFHVTECYFAKIAKELGIEDWISLYICGGDPIIAEGYNANICLKRTKTIMLGDDYCDHYYYWKNDPNYNIQK